MSGGVYLAPGSLRLAEFEEAAAQRLGPERVLSSALDRLGDSFDHVVIDCPPRADGVLCANAVRAADTVLLAVEVGAFALQGAVRARALFLHWAEELGFQMDLRVVATLFDRRTRFSRDVLVAMQSRFGESMFNTAIRQSVRLREAAAYGTTIQELSPRSRAASDFKALTRELAHHAETNIVPKQSAEEFSAPRWVQILEGEPEGSPTTPPPSTTPSNEESRPVTPRPAAPANRPEEGVGGPF